MTPTLDLTDASPADRNAPERSIRLVLVEDDDDFREAATAELKDLGFEVECFADGAAVLDGFRGGVTADLIVLDWDLPGLSGIDLIPRLRHAGVLVPVIMLTGRSTPRLEGPTMRMPVRATISRRRASRRAPSPPASLKPAARIVATFTPQAPHSSTASMASSVPVTM